MKSRSPQAIVIGLNINALGTVRALARRGVRVLAISPNVGTASEATRYCEKLPFPDLMRDETAVLEALDLVSRRLDAPAVVFPSSDLHLPALATHRETLEKHYRFPMPDSDTVSLVLNKTRFYRFALDRGLPIASTYFPADPDEIDSIAARIAYPCVIKPSIATPAWRRQGLKIVVARDARTLTSRYREIWAYHHDFIVQEVVPGPDSALQFSLTYLDGTGSPLAMFTGRKLRQWVPRYGISSMAVSEWSAEVNDLSLQTLEELGYRGYGSVEFKRDPRNGRLCMTEVTARTWYPHALSERCGVNLPYLAYCDLLGLPLPAVPPSYPDGVKWIDEVADFRSAYSYWREGELTLGGWLRSYQGRKHWALLSWDDPLPGVKLFFETVFGLMRAAAGSVLRLGRWLTGRREPKPPPGREASGRVGP